MRPKYCRTCNPDGEFHNLNDTCEYSGIEISLNSKLKIIRVRIYGDSLNSFTTQDVVVVSNCPHCGRRL